MVFFIRLSECFAEVTLVDPKGWIPYLDRWGYPVSQCCVKLMEVWNVEEFEKSQWRLFIPGIIQRTGNFLSSNYFMFRFLYWRAIYAVVWWQVHSIVSTSVMVVGRQSSTHCSVQPPTDCSYYRPADEIHYFYHNRNHSICKIEKHIKRWPLNAKDRDDFRRIRRQIKQHKFHEVIHIYNCEYVGKSPTHVVNVIWVRMHAR